jgi:hypothetical protein
MLADPSGGITLSPQRSVLSSSIVTATVRLPTGACRSRNLASYGVSHFKSETERVYCRKICSAMLMAADNST